MANHDGSRMLNHVISLLRRGRVFGWLGRSRKELAFSRMVDRGLSDSEAGRVSSHEEMGRRIQAWPR